MTVPDYRHTVFLPKTDFPMKAGLPEKEPVILARWQAAGLYSQLRAARAGREKFILHDGPPYANGDMHIGHALNHILKDMVVRTQTLLGKDAPYVPGWDCHGLPIEWKVEEQYRAKKLSKDAVPIVEFRAECRAYAQHWVDTQREQLKRLGINGNWDKPYLTMDAEAEGTIVAELLKFAESGQLYRGAKPVMWSPVEKTALAEAEVEYEDIVSTQVDVAFEIVESPIPELVGAYAVIWTTTPWTIPVNQAIAYGPEVGYLHVGFEPETEGTKHQVEVYRRLTDAGLDWHGKRFVIAEPLVQSVLMRLNQQAANVDLSDLGLGKAEYYAHPWQAEGEPETYLGSDLAGTVARHPMHTYLRHSREGGNPSPAFSAGDDGREIGPRLRGGDGEGGAGDQNWERALAFFARPRPFLPGDFVTTEQGTGLVHMAPDHGEDDFDLCKAHGIDPVFAVEGDGRYRADWAWLGGQGSVINAKFNAPDGPICSDLRAAGALLAASADYKHSYPHSWRSKAKVIFRATPQWFIAMDASLPSPLAGEGERREAARGEGLSGVGSHPLSPLAQGGESPSPARGEGKTLRATALAAIRATRWLPAKGENRIRSMVESRPDWVISRQRAWGVPITLFVDRRTGHTLVDAQVNARIVAAVKAGGVDAWSDDAAQTLLGTGYRAADYERQTDILDVWFDSGCTHVFTLESGRWPELRQNKPGPPADLYLEGSDQHRGWFQSSLLESCGTRGRAPYKAVLTHGFTMDQSGRKQSKSLGNTTDPIALMKTSGADIIRLWALTADFTEDHRIGDEILKGVADQYRKLRNTFRYLLGALDGWDEAERVPVAEMPELERWVLHRLAEIDAELRRAADDFDFNAWVGTLSTFVNNDLSAFVFDIRKDALYCDAVSSPKRRAYRTVLDTLFGALVRWLAPVLVFTAEEVWATRYPDADSVHLEDWPAVSAEWLDQELGVKWVRLREFRSAVTEAIEPLRRTKELGSSNEANVGVNVDAADDLDLIESVPFSELCIVSEVIASDEPLTGTFYVDHNTRAHLWVIKTAHAKCARCWRHLPDVDRDSELCNRCDGVVHGH